MAILDFDTTPEANPQENDFSPLPEGRYVVTLSACETKKTRDETGVYLNAKFRVDGPSHSGRVFFQKYNILNKNPKAQEIGRGQWSRLIAALGHAGERDTDAVCGAQCEVHLVIKQSPGYDDSNEIKRVYPLTSIAPPSLPSTQKPSGPLATKAVAPPATKKPALKEGW